MSLLDEMDAFLANSSVRRRESLTKVPLEYHRDLEDAIDNSAAEYWSRNPRGDFQSFLKLAVPKLGKFAQDPDVIDRARQSFTAYADATREAVKGRGRIQPSLATGFSATPEQDADTAQAYAPQNYRPYGVPTDKLRQHVGHEVRDRANALADFNERVIPEVYAKLRDKNLTPEMREKAIAAYKAGDPAARDEVRRRTLGQMDSDESTAKLFDEGMSKFPVYKEIWNNSFSRGLFRGATNFSSKVASLTRIGDGADQADLRNTVAIGAGAAQDRTGAGFSSRFVDDTTTGVTESLLISGAGAGLGGAIAGTAAGAIGGSALLGGASTGQDAYQQARQMGISPGKSAAYGVLQGGLESGIELIGNKVLGPGLEAAWIKNTLDDVSASTFKSLAKQFGESTARAVIEEMPSEVATTIAQKVNDWAFGVDKDALQLDGLGAAIGDTIAQTIAQVGVSQTGRGLVDVWRSYKNAALDGRRQLPTYEQQPLPAEAPADAAQPNTPESAPQIQPEPTPAPVTDTTVVKPEKPVREPATASWPMSIGSTDTESMAERIRGLEDSDRENAIGLLEKIAAKPEPSRGDLAALGALKSGDRSTAAERKRFVDELWDKVQPAAIAETSTTRVPSQVDDSNTNVTLPEAAKVKPPGPLSERVSRRTAKSENIVPASREITEAPQISENKQASLRAERDQRIAAREAVVPTSRIETPEAAVAAAEKPAKANTPPSPEFEALLNAPETLAAIRKTAIWRASGTTANADDLISEAYMAARQRWQSFDQSKGDIQKWVKEVVRSVHADLGRKKMRKKRGADRTISADVVGSDGKRSLGSNLGDETAMTSEQDARRREFLQTYENAAHDVLDERERKIVKDHYEKGISYPEIAAKLGLKPDSVKKIGQKAREKLFAAMPQYQDGDFMQLPWMVQPNKSNATPLVRETSSAPVEAKGTQVAALDKLVSTPPPLMFQLAKSLGVDVLLFGKSVKPKDGKFAAGFAKKIAHMGPFLPGDKTHQLQIGLNRYTLTSEQLAAFVLAHEIGHIKDHLGPDDTHGQKLAIRDNILGHIQGLNNFMAEAVYYADGSSIDSKVFNRELLRLSEWWRGPFTEKGRMLDYRTSDSELYADAVSVLLNAPGELQSQAPKFYAAMLKFMNARPEFANHYAAMQKLLQGEGAGKGYLKIMRDMFTRGEDIIQASYRARIEAQQDAGIGFTQNLVTGLLDKFHPSISRAVDRGLWTNIYNIEKMHTTDSAQSAHVIRQTRLIDQARELGVTDKDFGALLAFERVAYGDRKKLGAANSGLFGPNTSREAIDELKDQYGPEVFGKLQSLADEFRRNFAALVDDAHDAGLVTDEMIKPMRENKFYAPVVIHRYLTDKVSPAIKAQNGTVEDMGNPAMTGILKGISLIAAIDRNRASRDIIDIEERIAKENGESVRFVPFNDAHQNTVHPAPGKAWIFYADKGIWKAAEVQKEIAQQINDPDIAVTRAAATWNKWLYAIFYPLHIAYNVSWAIGNPFLDFHRTLTGMKTGVESMGGKLSVASIMKAYWDMLLPAIQFGRGNITEPALQAIDDRVLSTRTRITADVLKSSQTPETFDRLKAEWSLKDLPKIDGPSTTIQQIKSAPMQAVYAVGRFIEGFGIASESISKLAADKLLRDRGFTPGEINFLVNNYAGTPHSRKHGQQRGMLNALFMYGRIATLGLASAFGRKTGLGMNAKFRKRFWVNQIKYTALPTVMSNLLLSGAAAVAYIKAFGDDEDDAILAYLKMAQRAGDKMTGYFRGSFASIPLFAYEDENGDEQFGFLSLPYDQTNKLAGIASKHAIDAVLSGDRYASGGHQGNEAFKELADAVMPGLTVPVNIGSTWFEYLGGDNPEDSFRGQPIIPRTAHEAGGWEAFRPMLAWTAAQFGVLSEVTSPIHESVLGTPFENNQPTASSKTAKALPFRRIFRVTSGNLTQPQRAAIKKDQQAAAQFTRSLPETYRELKALKSSVDRAIKGGSGNRENKLKATVLGEWETNVNALTRAIKKAESEGRTEDAKGQRETLTEMSITLHKAIAERGYFDTPEFRSALEKSKTAAKATLAGRARSKDPATWAANKQAARDEYHELVEAMNAVE